MSNTLEAVRKAIRDAMSCATGNETPITFKAHELNVLVKTLEDQERDMIAVEDTVARMRINITKIEDALSFQDFSECVPNDMEGIDDLYEVFVGESAKEGGHLFAYWSSVDGDFYIMSGDDNEKTLLESVLFWRPVLASPIEKVDLLGLLDLEDA